MKFIILGRLPRLHVGCIRVIRVGLIQIVFLINSKKRESKSFSHLKTDGQVYDALEKTGFSISDFSQLYFIYMNLFFP